ncbi:MAG: M50 family metallopeptidase, partial [Eubacteriales bacterium]
MLYILISLVIFGVLITVHEAGHFFASKTLGVQVNEFSVGMGPLIIQRKKGETMYSLRALPLGGFCALEGEEHDTDNPRSLFGVSLWRKLVILSAGSICNFILGFLIILALFMGESGFIMPTIGGFIDGYGTETSGLQAGDIVLEVDGTPIYNYNNLSILLGKAGDIVDFKVERNGEKLTLNDVQLPRQQRTDEDGIHSNLRGITIGYEIFPPTLANKVAFSWYNTLDFVRMIWMNLGDLVTGALSKDDLSGPIGIVDSVTQVGQQSETSADAVFNLGYFAALISINLGVMNLLPFPALDGGRIFFSLIN